MDKVPHSIDAEQSVLGAVMINPEALDTVMDMLRPDDFYRADHQRIWRAVLACSEANRPYDPVMLADFLDRAGALDEVGGMPYLGAIANNTPSAANVKHYAEVVRDRAMKRRLAQVADRIGDMARAPGSSRDALDKAQGEIMALVENAPTRGPRRASAILPDVIDWMEYRTSKAGELTGLSTGFIDLDRKTQGLHPQQLIIVAGRPSMGKCLSHDAELVLDDGSVVTIEEVVGRHRGQRVGTLTDDFRLARATPSAYVDDGIKPVFEVTTRLGRRVETTLTHPFLTLRGWRHLHELAPGDVVAVPRRLPVFGQERMRECEVKLLAYLIGDGGLTGNTVRFTNNNLRIAADFDDAVAAFGGLKASPVEKREGYAQSWRVAKDRNAVTGQRAGFAASLKRILAASGMSARAVAAAVGVVPATVSYWQQGQAVPAATTFGRLCAVLKVEPEQLAPGGLAAARKNGANPLAEWLRLHGLMGHGAAGKVIPAAVFRLSREQLALFLNRLFATDGWATVLKSGRAQLGYATVNERLARQVQHLLLRFGVIASLRLRWVKYRGTRRPSWQLDITHGESILTFAREIGIYGKEESVSAAAEAVAGHQSRTNTDLVPVEVWERIARAKGDLSWAALARKAGLSGSNLHVGRRALSRPRLARIALALGDRELLALANSDVYWDRIVSIVPAGERQVYDLTIPETHNFVANDVCVHNTTFAMNIAKAAYTRQIGVAVFSMEMSAEELLDREAASVGEVEFSHIRSGDMDEKDWAGYNRAMPVIKEAPLFIDDSPALTVHEIRARARRIKRECPALGLIVVDYIQLMSGEGERRESVISECSRGLKSLAKELKVPVVALSQLNRNLEQRPNKRPRMSDLRESGAIEQDADLILFLYRDEVYDENSVYKGMAECIIGKQRSGELGMVPLTFQGNHCRFVSFGGNWPQREERPAAKKWRGGFDGFDD